MTSTRLVTGGTGGIGFEAARALARSGARVLLTARTAEQGDAIVARLRSETGSANVDWVRLDLGSLESVRACARAAAERCLRLDVLVANEGADGRSNERGGPPNSFSSCDPGAPGTQGVGVCKAGSRTCNALGTAFGDCIGAVLPTAESCDRPGDDDCDGQFDEGCP